MSSSLVGSFWKSILYCERVSLTWERLVTKFRFHSLWAWNLFSIFTVCLTNGDGDGLRSRQLLARVAWGAGCDDRGCDGQIRWLELKERRRELQREQRDREATNGRGKNEFLAKCQANDPYWSRIRSGFYEILTSLDLTWLLYLHFFFIFYEWLLYLHVCVYMELYDIKPFFAEWY